MKKTQAIELFNIIKKTKVTFIAIIIFVTMGLALFFGISWSGTAIENSANDYFKIGKLADIELVAPESTDDQVVQSISEIEGVSDVEGFYKAYEFWNYKGTTYQVRISSLTQKINTPIIIKGDLPSLSSQIAVENNFANTHGINIGDEISFSASATSLLINKTFKVSAIIKTAPYLSNLDDMYGIDESSGIPVNCLMFAPASCFNTESGYSSVCLRYDSLRKYNYFSNDYKNSVNALMAQLNERLSLKSITVPSQYITTSLDNTSNIALSMMSDIFDKLKFSMAGLFVIIGLLVCYFAVSRIVYESTTLIGTKKALGFTKREIVLTYLCYAGLAALIGSIIGSLGARFIVEPILLPAIRNVYSFENVIYFFDFVPAFLFALFEIAIQMLTVYIACCKLFRKPTLSLLQGVEPPKAKKRFYEKTKLFNKLSLFMKTVINNFFNDKRRVISTIVGICACASLVVCAITLNNHILGSFTKQYDNVFDYDYVLYYDSTRDTPEIETTLEENNITNYAKVFSTMVSLEMPNGKNVHAYLYVADTDDLNKIIKLYDLDGNRLYPTEGFYSSCSYQEEFGVKTGDKITFNDMFQKEHNVKVNGYFEYYLINNLLITDAETFKTEFNLPFVPTNTIFLNSNGKDFNALSQALQNKAGFIYLRNSYEAEKISFDGFANVFTIIVAVYLIIAVAMAFLVLLNLFVMFVAEKKKELLTLMINGYSLKDAKRYLYLDTIFLSIIGIILGLVFGTIMADISLSAYKNETMYFISGFDLMGCLIGVAFTALLTFITCFMALRKIKTFKLTSANE